MTQEEERWKATQELVGRYLDGEFDLGRLALLSAKWADEHPKSLWISVDDRLPEESGKHKGWLSDTVFVITNKSDGTSARYDLATKTWCPAKILQGRITHWMPIPKGDAK